jgi:D-serine deaminase-like pyridoxal phosphate-dependent protein
VNWKALLQSERLPAALIDLDAFESNLRHIAGVVRSKNANTTIRLATKSIRIPELIRRVLAFGPPYKGLMCFSAEEVE